MRKKNREKDIKRIRLGGVSKKDRQANVDRQRGRIKEVGGVVKKNQVKVQQPRGRSRLGGQTDKLR